MQKDFITVKELYRDKEQYIGKDVTVAGWIRTSRGSKNFGFIELNDGSFLQYKCHIELTPSSTR